MQIHEKNCSYTGKNVFSHILVVNLGGQMTLTLTDQGHMQMVQHLTLKSMATLTHIGNNADSIC